MSSFPVHDWQFWAVTAVFIAAVAWLGRGVVPALRGKKAASHKATLTVGGKPVGSASRTRDQ